MGPREAHVKNDVINLLAAWPPLGETANWIAFLAALTCYSVVAFAAVAIIRRIRRSFIHANQTVRKTQLEAAAREEKQS
jgi:hypothetical protein